MIRYYITDRQQLGGTAALLDCVKEQIRAGVDWLQIREKDLTDRELATLVRRVMDLRNTSATRILVNGRLDIALACGADGVHLPGGSIAPFRLRQIAPPAFLIGVSCHTVEEVRAAEVEGANFVVYGPVFAPLSKPIAGPVVGLDGLTTVCAAVKIPVLALGGIIRKNARACLESGAAGVAGVSLFQSPDERTDSSSDPS